MQDSYRFVEVIRTGKKKEKEKEWRQSNGRIPGKLARAEISSFKKFSENLRLFHGGQYCDLFPISNSGIFPGSQIPHSDFLLDYILSLIYLFIFIYFLLILISIIQT